MDERENHASSPSEVSYYIQHNITRNFEFFKDQPLKQRFFKDIILSNTILQCSVPLCSWQRTAGHSDLKPDKDFVKLPDIKTLRWFCRCYFETSLIFYTAIQYCNVGQCVITGILKKINVSTKSSTKAEFFMSQYVMILKPPRGSFTA